MNSVGKLKTSRDKVGMVDRGETVDEDVAIIRTIAAPMINRRNSLGKDQGITFGEGIKGYCEHPRIAGGSPSA